MAKINRRNLILTGLPLLLFTAGCAAKAPTHLGQMVTNVQTGTTTLPHLGKDFQTIQGHQFLLRNVDGTYDIEKAFNIKPGEYLGQTIIPAGYEFYDNRPEGQQLNGDVIYALVKQPVERVIVPILKTPPTKEQMKKNIFYIWRENGIPQIPHIDIEGIRYFAIPVDPELEGENTTIVNAVGDELTCLDKLNFWVMGETKNIQERGTTITFANPEEFYRGLLLDPVKYKKKSLEKTSSK